MLVILAPLLHATGLEFTETSKTVESPADTTSLKVEFPFTNKGNKTVTIASSDSGCSCSKVEVSEGKLKYAPGESGSVRATFDTGNYSGTVDKTIKVSLITDSTQEPLSVSLSLKINIPVLISLEPKTLQWSIGEKAEPKTIKINIAEGHAINVTGVNSSSEAFTQELKKSKDGKEYELIITPNDTADASLALFRIETDCAIQKYRMQQAFAVVRKSANTATTSIKP